MTTNETYIVNWKHTFSDKVGTNANCSRQEVNALTTRSDIYVTDIIKRQNGKRALLYCDDTGFTAEQYIHGCTSGILTDFDISIIKWLSLSEPDKENDLATRMKAGRASFVAKSQSAQLLVLYDYLTELAATEAKKPLSSREKANE